MSHAEFRVPPVLIVGVPRSGTSLVCEILGGHPDINLLIEPHALWKSGDFKSLDDDDRLPSSATRQWLRSRMVKFAGGKQLVEKSPVNCLRPDRVHAVFPEAKVVYLERDAAACVYSNIQRSQAKDAFKPSLVLKKYLGKTGDEGLPHARSFFPLWKQLRLNDLLPFGVYVLRMLALRRQGKVPFGPRLPAFSDCVPSSNWEEYHCAVWEQAQQAKLKFATYYEDRMYTVQLEELAGSSEVARDLFSFIGVPVDKVWLEEVYSGISTERTQKRSIPEVLIRRFHEAGSA